MKRSPQVVFALGVFVACLIAMAARGEVLGIWFSPKGGATGAIVARLDKATKSVEVQMYNFTSKPLADALIAADKRGVEVTLLLDKSANSGRNLRRSQADECQRAGCDVYLDGKHQIAHSKVCIIDSKLLFSGSFNWTKSAEERNAEELRLEDNATVVARYRANFQHHLAHAERMR